MKQLMHVAQVFTGLIVILLTSDHLFKAYELERLRFADGLGIQTISLIYNFVYNNTLGFAVLIIGIYLVIVGGISFMISLKEEKK